MVKSQLVLVVLLACVAAFCFARIADVRKQILHGKKNVQKKQTAATNINDANAPIGAAAIVLPTGLNTLAQDLTKLIIKEVLAIKVPDFTGVQKVPLLGDIEYTISKLSFNTMKIGKIALTTVPPNQFKVTCADIEFGITLHWATREKNWPHSTANGDALIRTSSASAVGLVEALPMQNMKPAFKAVQISVDMGQFYIKISGGVVPAILNMLESMFHGVIKNYIQSTIAKQITFNMNNNLNPLIQNASFVVDLPGPLRFALDLSMPVNFGFGANSLFGAFIGEFLPLSKQHGSIDPPVPLPSQPVGSQGFQAFFSDFTFNSFGYSLVANGYLNKNITPEQVPASSPIQLNTTSLKYMLPDLYAKYPNRGVQVAIKPLGNVNFKTSANKGFSAMYSTNMFFSVINADQDNTTTPVFILRGDFAATVNALGIVPVAVAKFNVTGNIAEVNTSLVLQESFIGNMSVTNLNNMIRILVKNGVVAYYNKLLKAGITVNLPAESGLVISNPEIKFNDGYTYVASDVDYSSDGVAAKNVEKQVQKEEKSERLVQVLNKIKALRMQIDALQEEVQALL